MLLNGKVNFVNNAIGGTCKINGMYIVYTADATTELPTITVNASLQEVVTAISNTPNAGICRADAIAVDVNTAVSSGTLANTSGTVIANTANAHDVAGMPISAGVYVRGAITAHLTESPSSDIGFDYTAVTSNGAVVIPANGGVTIIDKVTIQ